MRLVRYSVAMSLDGYIAGPDGDHDWIVMDPDLDFAEFASAFDTYLMGRKTFEATRTMQGEGEAPASPGVRDIVFSRTLDAARYPRTEIVRDAERAVRELKEQPGKDIWLFGGGELFRGLLAAGLVDRVEVAVIPVLLGGGVPLLPGPAMKARLRLRSHRLYGKTGTVALEYDVVRG